MAAVTKAVLAVIELRERPTAVGLLLDLPKQAGLKAAGSSATMRSTSTEDDLAAFGTIASFSELAVDFVRMLSHTFTARIVNEVALKLIMARKPHDDLELFIRRQIVKRWTKGITEAPNTAYVFSPYLTSRTAETVLLASSVAKKCEVHTVFDAEVFASGASSLHTVKRLAKTGVPIFSLRNLHAKLIIVPSVFASIGSQNITAGGTKRLEATIVTTNKVTLKNIWEELQEWLAIRSPITVEMIDDMQNLIGPLARKFRRLQTELLDLTAVVQQNESYRTQERKRQEREEDKRRAKSEAKKREFEQRRKNTTRTWLENTEKSQRVASAQIIPIHGRRWADHSLVTTAGDLTSWRIEGHENIYFPRLHWCLCTIKDEWSLAFVRVGKRRITFVQQALIRKSHTEIAGKQCGISFDVNRDIWRNGAGEDGPNLTCELTLGGGQGKITLPSWFGLDGIEFFEPLLTKGYWSHEDDLLNWFTSNRNDIAMSLLEQLARPFRYDAGSLNSYSAIRFFGAVRERLFIEAATVAGHPILVATRRK